MRRRTAEASLEKEAREKLHDELESVNRQIKKLKDRLASVKASDSDVGSTDGKNVAAVSAQRQSHDRCSRSQELLRCRCCVQGFKEQMLLKCKHSEYCTICEDAAHGQCFVRIASTHSSRRDHGGVLRVKQGSRRRMFRICFGAADQLSESAPNLVLYLVETDLDISSMHLVVSVQPLPFQHLVLLNPPCPHSLTRPLYHSSTATSPLTSPMSPHRPSQRSISGASSRQSRPTS